MRALTILLIIVVYCFSSCSNLTDPSNKDAKDYFIEQCIGKEVEILSDFGNNTHINFELVSKIKQQNKYDFYYRAEIEYMIDGSLYRKGDKRYYEGIISFWRDDKGWNLQSVTVYGEPCRR